MESFIYCLIILVTMAKAPVLRAADPDVPGFISDERKLYHHLMDNYERAIRPVNKSSDTIQLQFGVTLIRMADLDEQAQKLTTNVWLKMMWKDAQLTWDPAEHSGIASLRLPCEKVWLPDIVLYNSAHHNEDIIPRYEWMNIVVSSDGSVIYIPHHQMDSTCKLDMTKFPYDTHQCVLKFGSWVYSKNLVNMSFYGGDYLDTSEYGEHGEWDLTDHKAVLNEKKYDCCLEAYQDVTYTLTIERRSSYYSHVFVTPSVILCLITPTIFGLPPDGSEKMALGTGIMLGHVLLLVMLENYIPSAHPVVPMIGVYYIFGLVMAALALVLAVMVRHIWSQGNRRRNLPRIVRTVVLGLLGRLLCVRREPYMPVQELQDMDGEDDRTNANKVANISSKGEWRQLAVIVDRLCFVVFVLITIIVSIAMLA